MPEHYADDATFLEDKILGVRISALLELLGGSMVIKYISSFLSFYGGGMAKVKW